MLRRLLSPFARGLYGLSADSGADYQQIVVAGNDYVSLVDRGTCSDEALGRAGCWGVGMLLLASGVCHYHPVRDGVPSELARVDWGPFAISARL